MLSGVPRRAALGLAAFALALGAGPAARAAEDVPVTTLTREATATRVRLLMGTTCRAEMVAETEELAAAAAEGALDEIARWESLLSTWRPEADMARANAAASAGVAPLSRDLARALEFALAQARATGGAFDPVVGALVDAWDVRGAGRVPSAAELELARAASGSRVARLDVAGRTLEFTARGAWIDTGGFGKGLALDRAALAARQAGATAGLLDFGGQLLAFGARRGTDIAIGVADPRDREEPVLLLALREASASTSAQSERSLDVAGRAVGHVLDPRTGEPVAFSGSATVVAVTAAEADALSTALLVMGPRAGLAHAREHRLCAGFLVPASREGREVLLLRATPSFLALVKAAAPDVFVRGASPERRSLPR